VSGQASRVRVRERSDTGCTSGTLHLRIHSILTVGAWQVTVEIGRSTLNVGDTLKVPSLVLAN
jgi:hypothetical protein